MSERRSILVTGGNRGMGLETARQLAALGHHVTIGSRDHAAGIEATHGLLTEGLEVGSVQLDVTDRDSAERAISDVIARHGRIDGLINNAGVLTERWGEGGLAALSEDVLNQVFDVNVKGALRMARLVVPHMRENGYGRIVNVSSKLGQMATMSSGHPAYQLSKVALNGITVLLASELKDGNFKVNSSSPGWVATDLGGASAPRSVAEGSDTTVWLATLPADGPTGGFFHDRQRIDW